jgi:hypothetical protein
LLPAACAGERVTYRRSFDERALRLAASAATAPSGTSSPLAALQRAEGSAVRGASDSDAEDGPDSQACITTDVNRMHLVLFDMHNRTTGPYLVATHRVLYIRRPTGPSQPVQDAIPACF